MGLAQVIYQTGPVVANRDLKTKPMIVAVEVEYRRLRLVAYEIQLRF